MGICIEVLQRQAQPDRVGGLGQYGSLGGPLGLGLTFWVCWIVSRAGESVKKAESAKNSGSKENPDV